MNKQQEKQINEYIKTLDDKLLFDSHGSHYHIVLEDEEEEQLELSQLLDVFNHLFQNEDILINTPRAIRILNWIMNDWEKIQHFINDDYSLICYQCQSRKDYSAAVVLEKNRKTLWIGTEYFINDFIIEKSEEKYELQWKCKKNETNSWITNLLHYYLNFDNDFGLRFLIGKLSLDILKTRIKVHYEEETSGKKFLKTATSRSKFHEIIFGFFDEQESILKNHGLKSLHEFRYVEKPDID